MTVAEMKEAILAAKKENDFCVLAHAYQSHDIWEVADYVGDSFGLCVQASKSPAKNILMCGVRFMAETVKILSPQKRVFLSNPGAGCPMAEQMDKDLILGLKEQTPDVLIAAYINTTAELKTVCDVCVTSSSAVRILRALPARHILFIPDCNLGEWAAGQIPDKEIELVRGGCPTHVRISPGDVTRARKEHPDALILCHPECLPAVWSKADFVGSTTEIMDYAKKSDAPAFVIGTETSIVEHLQFDCPQKRFYPLSKDCVCHNMKLTTLSDVLGAVSGRAGEEILMDSELIQNARKPIEAMLSYGG